ncbi:hypothetical protein J5X84_18495 [Streptosporangiaceae bacterium NEAU-GS5]|nr:hypothetical protein [Streptosporangiaceae bacterium NEAU-GS5]
MTAVILGLVAVVLLVLVVVALGMRSMNRRESALSSERLKAMAENKGPKRARPAEETFFESFPEGFDAFEEPSAKANRTRPPRPAPRPGGRQAAKGEARGRRGVDEWGDQDDYDDDYWSRVRADEGGFGGSGTVHARMATPRPVTAQEQRLASGGPSVDPDAATVQAPLPKRPTPVSAPVAPAAAGLADLVEPLRASTGPSPVSPTPTGPVPGANGIDPFSTDAFSTGAVVSPFAGTGAFGGTGPFPSATNPDLVAPLRATPSSAAAEQKTQTFAAPTPDVLAALGGQATGPMPAVDPSQPPPSVRFTASTDAFERGRVTPDPYFGTPVNPPAGSSNGYATPGTGPFAAPSPGAYAADANGATYQHTPPTGFPQPPATGPFETPRPSAYEQAASYDASRGAYGTTPAAPQTPEPAPWGGATPYQPEPSPSWPASPGVRDILDDPEPPRGAAYQQQPAYDGYTSPYGSAQATPYASNATNYEVSNGWATIDDSDTLNSARPGAAAAPPSYDPAGYDQRPYEQPPAQPAPSGGGGWPSYDELYGSTNGNGAQPTGSRRGNHRTPDSDYPEYYR